MKTLNIFALCLIFVLGTFSANAQGTNKTNSKANTEDVVEYVPISEASSFIGEAATCYHTDLVAPSHWQKDIHGGFSVVAKGGFDRLTYENPTQSGTTNSFGAELGLQYKYLKKSWVVAPVGEVTGGWYSAQNIEGLSTDGSLNVSGAIGFEILPHWGEKSAPIKLSIFYGLRYVNTVSKASRSTTTYTETESQRITEKTSESRLWQGNAFSTFIEGRITCPIAKITSTRSGYVRTNLGRKVPAKVTETREITMFVSVNYTLPSYSVAQQWDRTILSERSNLRFNLGVTIPLGFK